MIIADTSIWIDNYRRADSHLLELARARQLLMHPLVVGELAMGTLPSRDTTLSDFQRMLCCRVATHREVLSLVEAHRLWGRGLGYVDASLLAAALLTENCLLWTRDRRLLEAATALGVEYAA